jgi:CTP synthase (UTP-ammonia lyase)
MFYISEQLYGNKDRTEERHRHRYEVNPKYVPQLESAAMRFVGKYGSTHIVECKYSLLLIPNSAKGSRLQPAS